jgi:hypothetical protein
MHRHRALLDRETNLHEPRAAAIRTLHCSHPFFPFG